MTEELGVGIVGFGWMGETHARAYARLRHHFPDAPLRPRPVAVADTAEDGRLDKAVEAYGFEHALDDWHTLVVRDDVDVVSVTGPNFIHREVGIAAAEAGKHLWIEKPAGRGLVETREIASAAEAAGVRSAVGFNYRNAPAVQLAADLVAGGRIGAVQSTRVCFSADYAAHPDGALTWRFRNELAGTGVLGDLVSHAADLARFVVAEIAELVADEGRFVTTRPRASGVVSHFSRGGGGPRGEVENEDYIGALVRFADGSRGVLESSRTAVGEQCTYGIEVHGETGALAWDFRRMGELRVCLDQDYQNASYATVHVPPDVGGLGAFQPGAGIAMGYDDLKVVEARSLVDSIATGVPAGATLDDAVAAAEVVAAIVESIEKKAWVRL